MASEWLLAKVSSLSQNEVLAVVEAATGADSELSLETKHETRVHLQQVKVTHAGKQRDAKCCHLKRVADQSTETSAPTATAASILHNIFERLSFIYSRGLPYIYHNFKF